MSRIIMYLVLSFFVLTLVSLPAYAQRETGAIQGTITDSEGRPVPGVTVTATNTTLVGRVYTTYTDEAGRYRFPSLDPGTYEIKAELEGFQTAIRSDARLFVGNTITVDISIGQTVAEELEITGETPLIDATSSASSKTVPAETLEDLPKFSFALDIFTLTPGVNDIDYVAYGAGGSQANAYWFDGVDLSNPVSGSYWVYPNFNWIEEVQVVGLGAPAEYGNFTGVITNSISKSGSNQFHGLFETFFQNDSLTSNNSDDPELEGEQTDLFTDSTVQLSGPIIEDKLWFFASGQWYYSRYAPFGYPPDNSGALVKDDQPRVLGKLTFRANENNTLQGFLEWDNYLRDGQAADAFTLEEATGKIEAPEWFYNASWVSILNSETVLDVRFSGYNARYDIVPRNGQTPQHCDFGTGICAVNYWRNYDTDRTRNQINASVSHYARDFIKGSHDFKFGIEYEHSNADRTETYTGGIYYLDYYGAPYYRYLWEGYDSFGRIRRQSVFAQDSWHISDKVNLNIGVRYDRNHVFLEEAPDIEFTTNSVAPRLGFTYDLKGNQKTIIKAHYGHYYQKAVTFYIDGIDDFGDRTIQYFNGTDWETVSFRPGTSAWTIDNDIKQPYTQQFTAGFDHAFDNGFTLTANYIYRKEKDLIEDVGVGGVFEEVPFVNPLTGETITVFNQINGESQDLLITNAPQLFRDFNGVEIVGGKRFGNKASLNGSILFSKNEGNVGNTDNRSDGFSFVLDDPNYNINNEGKLDYDTPVEFKIYGSYRAPWEILASFYYRYFSGYTFTPTIRIPGSVINQGPINVFAVPRGSERLDARHVFDLRFEKGFVINPGELKFTVDIFNLFNEGDIYTLELRSERGNFLDPTELTSPREIRLGVRYQF